MYDHIGLHVKDLTASLRFFESTLAPLGLAVTSRDAAYAGLGPNKDDTQLWLHPVGADATGCTHVAFRAKDRAAVVQPRRLPCHSQHDGGCAQSGTVLRPVAHGRREQRACGAGGGARGDARHDQAGGVCRLVCRAQSRAGQPRAVAA